MVRILVSKTRGFSSNLNGGAKIFSLNGVMVSILRLGRSGPGSNPGLETKKGKYAFK